MADRGGASHPLIELTRTRLLEFFREPEAVFWVFVFPILLALGLGIAFGHRGIDPVIVGIEAGPGARELADRLGSSRGIVARSMTAGQGDVALRNGDVQVVVTPGTPPRYRFDPTRPESRLARLVVDEVLQRAAGRTDVWQARDDVVTERGSRYIDWVIPGLLGMNIMGTGLWGIGFPVVQARAKNLLKRLLATPMARAHYLLSHLLARLVFLGLEVGALLSFAVLLFGVPVRGSLAAVGALTVIGALAFGGLGLLLASRARTVEVVSGLVNFVQLPMWVLSGVFFSSANFPPAMQPFIRALPLTALNDALRAVILDGKAITAVGSQVGVLVAWGSVSFALALRTFRWR